MRGLHLDMEHIMSDLIARAAAPAASYTPPVHRAALLADCLSRTISGRPLPEGLCPAPMPLVRPATVEAGLGWILAGRPAVDPS
jgi:hypothetical protein